MSALDVCIQNVESDIHRLENKDADLDPNLSIKNDLRALYNKQTALLRQNSIHWAQ